MVYSKYQKKKKLSTKENFIIQSYPLKMKGDKMFPRIKTEELCHH